MEPSFADYLNLDDIDNVRITLRHVAFPFSPFPQSDNLPDPALSPATLAMSPFSSMADGTSTVATMASNSFDHDAFADPMDFPICADDFAFDGGNDTARGNDMFSPFALTAPFPDFGYAQLQGAQATLMQSQQTPTVPAMDIANLLRQYNQPPKQAEAPTMNTTNAVEPPVVVKQEPNDDVLMSIDETLRSSGISPAALFSTGQASTTTAPTQDLSALYQSRAASEPLASEDEDDAHEAVTPSEHPAAQEQQIGIASGSRKSSVGVTAAKRARDSDGEENIHVKNKSTASTPFRELSVNYADDASLDASGSRMNLDQLKPLPLPSMFGGIKGKGGKKGGGLSSVVLEDPAEAGEDDDWRPTPEEYKKLSSKEKRQLRNKLSARAFRTRRKTYINELEDHIKDRDRLIDAIKGELMTSRSENDELK
jgi:hypothetical protein